MKRPLFAAAMLLTAVIWLILAAGGFDSPPAGRITGEQLSAGETLYITGQVCRKEEENIWLQSVTVLSTSKTHQQADGLEQKIPCTDKLICEIPEEAADLPLGSRVTVRGVFAPFSAASNPGEFDTAVYYRSLKVGGKLRKVELLSYDDTCWPVREAAYRVRQFFRMRLYGILPPESAGVMCALLLGDREELDGELKSLYQRNGILHILSISSLHITIIGMSLYKALRKIGIPIVPAAAAGSVILLFYGAMTGFGVSACRAIGMYLIRMGAQILGRSYDTLTALGILLAAMVLRNPHYLQNAGFLLSFSSVLGIAAFYPILSGERGRKTGAEYYGESKWRIRLRSFREKLRSAAGASFSITLSTLPVQLWYYYETPVYSVAVNLLILPLMKPLLVAGFCSLVPGLGFAAGINRTILWFYETLCSLFDRLPFHTWNPGRPSLWQIALYYGILLAAAAWKGLKKAGMGRKSRGKPERTGRPEETEKVKRTGKAETSEKNGNTEKARGRIRCAAIVLALVLLGLRPGGRDQVIFLDVGQGDCCLVRTASGQNYVFDCGSSSRGSVGRYVLLPCLKYYGIRRLDAVFVSHPDADHINGITELLTLAAENRLEITQLILPAVEKDAGQEQFSELLQILGDQTEPGNGTRVAWLSAGEAWSCKTAEFICLHPGRDAPADNTNAYSQCIYAEFERFSLLLTGDVEGEGEQALLRELQNRKITGVSVLKVAHHGSRNSTSRELLQQISPGLAVISCGKDNRYGHPHRELLDRLEDAGCRILQTPEKGAVTVEGVKGGIKVWGFRK
ncbi:MAG: ComEC/Rec2 family competence protein [bacterium]|nr:ComEC/Rec2 family competence protein [bacterium]